MNIKKVTTDVDKVTIEIHDGEFLPSTPKLNIVTVSVQYGVFSITSDIEGQSVRLVQDGKVEQQPLRQDSLNVILSQLESALNITRKLAGEES
jgi:hypothetical protein